MNFSFSKATIIKSSISKRFLFSRNFPFTKKCLLNDSISNNPSSFKKAYRKFDHVKKELVVLRSTTFDYVPLSIVS